MSLSNLDIDAIKSRVLSASEEDGNLLEKFREYARRLKDNVRPLRNYSVNAVSFVSADGGDNRVVFNPSVVELIRVVDSMGNQCALDAVASSSSLEEIEQRIKPGPGIVVPLQRLCNDLGVGIKDLSYLIRGLGQPGKSTGAIRCYRDIVEWAVLYDLVTNPNIHWGSDTILVRDGLLRTKSFKRNIFPQIDQFLRRGVVKHSERNVNLSIVGVAKQSAVLSRLAVALELEGTFHKSFPCYVQVDKDIEADCYNFDRTWLETYESAEEDENGDKLYQSLGKMFLVKFGDRPMDPIWPVDIAEWQVKDAPKILGQLMSDAQMGFPIPDYPMCIQKAHDFAKVSNLEAEILQDIIFQSICKRLSPEEIDRILRLKYLGQNLAALRYKEA